jgi:transcriptional regulator with XRE-family HTH domain
VKRIYLRAARERRGLTQEQLEESSGVPQAVISKLERNPDARPTFDTVIKLADALGVDPRALRFGQPEAIAS